MTLDPVVNIMNEKAVWQLEERNEVYYRLMYDEDANRIVVCCMQWFDEYDYDQSKFITDKKFKDETVAQRIATCININGFTPEIMVLLEMF
jgi:carbamoylphosphate synthase large subunit